MKRKKAKFGLKADVGDIATAALLGIDSLIPNNENYSPVNTPQFTYNPYVYGTGSSAIMKKGGKMKFSYKKGGILGEGEGENKNSSLTVNSQILKEWNNFLDFVNKKGMKGSKDLDLKDKKLGQSLFTEYKKTNPNSPLSYEYVAPVQKAISQYRSTMIEKFKTGKASLSKGLDVGPNYENFMQDLSKVDGWFGSKTSSWKFPQAYIETYNSDKQLENIQNLGVEGTMNVAKMKKGGILFSDKSNQKAENGTKLIDKNTIEFKGASHKNGGIDISFMGNNVEVEGNETGYLSPYDNSLTIGGNLKNPITGRKFKKDFKILAEKNSKLEKMNEEYSSLSTSPAPTNKWDMLKFNSGKAMMSGIMRKQKEIADAKEHLSVIQDVMIEKNVPKAKWGRKLGPGDTLFPYNNSNLFANPEWNKNPDKSVPPVTVRNNRIKFGQESITSTLPDISNSQFAGENFNKQARPIQLKKRYKGSPERIVPTNSSPLSFSQILPELYTAATNKQDGVFRQNYTPDLFTPYNVSFQDRRNANTSAFRALSERQFSDNPAAISTLAGQVYDANNQISGEEFRTNQGIEADVINKNTQLLNEAKSTNLQLADQQYVRQEQAKANTRGQNALIIQSIADKYKQNQLEQDTIKLYENLYKYRFDQQTGGAVNYNSIPEIDYSVPGILPINSNSDAARTVRTDKNNNIVSTTTHTAPEYVINKGKSDAYIKSLQATKQRLNLAKLFYK